MIDYHQPSPHQDQRPDPTNIKLLVIHNISLPPSCFDGPWIDDLFMGRLCGKAHPYFAPIAQIKVSSHLVIRRDGTSIQYVPFERRAWHAGVSSWQGENKCNDFSIGIELEGADDIPYTEAQYKRLAMVIKSLFIQYPKLAKETVCGHSDIAPGRKTDPGPSFDWQHLFALI